MVKRNIAIIILSAVVVVCLCVTAWALFFRDGEEPSQSADYPTLELESNQTPIEGDTGDKLESPEGGGAINVTFGTTATVSLSDKTVKLYYANPNASNKNVTVSVMIDDLTVASSGLISPGNQVTELKLDEAAISALSVGSRNAELVVRAYDVESGEKAMVDTKGNITLTVVE